MQPKKLSFYRPGMISLCLLPVVLYCFMPAPAPDYRCFKLNLPADRKPHKNELLFSRYTVLNSLKHKKVETIFFNTYYSKKTFSTDPKLQFIANEISRLTYLHDTTMVLKIELDDYNYYEDIMWLLNQATINVIRRYALVDYTLYIFPNEPPVTYKETIEPMQPDTAILPLIPVNDDFTAWERFTYELKTNLQNRIWEYEYYMSFKDNILLLEGFGIFIFGAAVSWMLKRRKRNA